MIRNALSVGYKFIRNFQSIRQPETLPRLLRLLVFFSSPSLYRFPSVKLQCRRRRVFKLFKIRKLQRRNEAFHALSANEPHYARLNVITCVYLPTLVEIFEAEKWQKKNARPEMWRKKPNDLTCEQIFLTPVNLLLNIILYVYGTVRNDT